VEETTVLARFLLLLTTSAGVEGFTMGEIVLHPFVWRFFGGMVLALTNE